MNHKPLIQIDSDDLRALVTNSVREIRRLEFKESLPGNRDTDKKEFLADVTSFANSGGGDIVYGMKELDGVASDAIGLRGLNVDAEILRIESMIRDGVEPRIPGVHSRAVDGFAAGPILILRVPRSWAGPHMVTYKNASRFYTRTSNGKFQMDVTEIRAAFEESAELPQRIARWRDERIGRIVANDGPIAINSRAFLIVHLVPLESFATVWRFQPSEMSNEQVLFRPLGSNGWSNRLNIDGFATYSQDRDDRSIAHNYTQLFRSGRVEAVTGNLLHDKNRFVSPYYERDTLDATCSYLKGLRKLGVAPPIVFLLSMTGVKGASLYPGDKYMRSRVDPFDRDVLMLPDVTIESFDDNVAEALRPAFDAVWNACGMEGSYNYDSNGEWKPQ